MKITGNEPAFPFLASNEAGYGNCVVVRSNEEPTQFFHYTPGLTIRQYFAISIMQGLAAGPASRPSHAVQYADALIKELNQTPNPNE